MKQYDISDYNSFVVCGDIHGEFSELLYKLKLKNVTDAVIVIAGDCGIGFEKPAYYEQLYNRIEKTLDKINCLFLLIRGNHDDPEYFQKGLLNFKRMKTIPDYSLLKFKYRNILSVGGGLSIDRIDRIEKMKKDGIIQKNKPLYYWVDEMPFYDEHKISEITVYSTSIDTVITHTCPSFCFPTDKPE